MSKKAIITSKCLKDFLLLFDPISELKNLTLGDTCHPSDGYVNEKILNGKSRISDLLDFDYDFKGLVHFEAELGSMRLKLVDDENSTRERYDVWGTPKDLQLLSNKVIELNAVYPEKYNITIVDLYLP